MVLLASPGYPARRGTPPLSPAPAPRRFAQGVAAVFMTAAGVLLMVAEPMLAAVFEVGLIAALSMLLFGKFCLGAYIFHVLRGELRFANSTLPWAPPRP